MSGSRHLARKNAIQALYQWDMTDQAYDDVEQHYIVGEDIHQTDLTYFRILLRGVTNNKSELDDMIKKYISRRFEDLNPVELSILRVSIYELKYELSNPYKSLLNEAINLTKEYGANDGYKFVNAILDKVARELRPKEQN